MTHDPRFAGRTAFIALMALVPLLSSTAPGAWAASQGTSADPGQTVWSTRFRHGVVAAALRVSPDGSRVFVTGVGGPRQDYATVAYDPATGAQLWSSRYSAAMNSYDGALALAVSPDGSTVFVTGESVYSGSYPDYATVAYDASTGAELWVSRYDGPGSTFDNPAAVMVTPDGSTVVVTGKSVGSGSSGDFDYATVAYDASTGAELWVSRYDGPANGTDVATSLGVSTDGSLVFVSGYSYGWSATADYATAAYDAGTGAELWVSRYDGPDHSGELANALGVSSDGSMVFVTGYSYRFDQADYATVAYDAITGAERWVSRYNGPVNDGDVALDLAVSPDASALFVTGVSKGSGTSDDYATVAYDAVTGAELWASRYNGPGNAGDLANALGVSPDSSMVFVTGYSSGVNTATDYATVAYDTATGAEVWVSRAGHTGEDSAIALGVSPDASTVFVSGSGQVSPTRTVFATIAYST